MYTTARVLSLRSGASPILSHGVRVYTGIHYCAMCTACMRGSRYVCCKPVRIPVTRLVPQLHLPIMSAAVPCDITLKRIVCVQVPGQRPWHIDTTMICGGVEMVVLKHRDNGFCSFIGGTVKQFRSKDFPFLKEIVHKRTQATAEALNPATNNPFENVQPTIAAKRKARSAAKARAGRREMPECVDISFPMLELPDGTHVGPISVKVQASLNARDAPAVQLDVRVLQYIRAAMQLASELEDSEPPAKALQVRGSNVRWRESRKCWIASRQNKRFRTFKPETTECEVSLKESFDKAQTCVNCDDCFGASGNDEGSAHDDDDLCGDADISQSMGVNGTDTSQLLCSSSFADDSTSVLDHEFNDSLSTETA